MIQIIELPYNRSWFNASGSDPIMDLRRLHTTHTYNCVVVPRAAHCDLASHPLLRTDAKKLSEVNGGDIKKAFKEVFEHQAAIDNYIVGHNERIMLLNGDDIVAEIIFEGE